MSEQSNDRVERVPSWEQMGLIAQAAADLACAAANMFDLARTSPTQDDWEAYELYMYDWSRFGVMFLDEARRLGDHLRLLREGRVRGWSSEMSANLDIIIHRYDDLLRLANLEGASKPQRVPVAAALKVRPVAVLSFEDSITIDFKGHAIVYESLRRAAEAVRAEMESMSERPELVALPAPSRSRIAATNGRAPEAPAEMPDLVTLDQAAAAAHTSKRTLERHKTEGTLPDPVREGGGGKHALYDWRVIGPWLTKTFGINLPEKFPANRR